jgi:hypothetical protein
MLNDPDLVVRAAVDGLGIAYTIEALADPFLGRVVKLVEMPTAGISDGQVTGLSGLIKQLLGRGEMKGLPAVDFA